MAGRFDLSNRPNPLAGLTSFTYGPGVGDVQESAAINTHQGFSITAEIERSGPADGVLAAMGGKTSGWSLYVRNGRPVFYYNFFSLAGYRADSSQALPEGKHGPRRVRSRGEGLRQARGGDAVREWAGDGEGSGREDGSVGYSGEGFDVGADNISSVSPDYTSPFAFGGTIRGVTIAQEK